MTNASKTYLLTGASSGIGHAVGELLCTRGAQLLTIGRRLPGLSERFPDRIRHVYCDLADTAVINQKVAPVLRQSDSLAGAVICHGFGDFGALEQFSSQRIEELVTTNLTSVLLLGRLIIPLLKTRGSGDVIVIGSEAGLKAGKNGAVYCATKFALRGFAHALREECAASGIRIGLINPGMVDTPFFDNLDFAPGESRDNALCTADVARAVAHMIDAPEGSVVDEINLSPQKTVIRNK